MIEIKIEYDSAGKLWMGELKSKDSPLVSVGDIMASPDELLAMLEEAASEAENAHQEQDRDEYEDVVEELMEELVDEVSLGLCFEVHRACKLDVFFLDETDKESQKKYEISGEKGRDVFGHVPMKKQLECVCPNCSRNLAASRFAPHLEKCMGMGRNSSRIASRRIARSGKAKEEVEEDHGDSENEDNDSEWNFSSDRRDRKGRSKKFKKEKNSNNSPRKLKQLKGTKNGRDSPNVTGTMSENSALPAAYECLGPDERKALLVQTCGVISEHTRKMCTRSQRCPQHSDEQRRDVRAFLLRTPSSLDADTDVTVDIDSYEDGDAQALRDSLQWEASSNPSPADSTSTTNSTTSSRKKKPGKASKKKPSSKASSRAGTPSSLCEY